MKKYFSIFIYAVLAGFCIGLGGTVFLRIKDAFPGGNVVGALLFTIGLFVICTRGYNLFTGKVCYLFDNKPSYVASLGVIWLGNLVGTLILAGLELLTGMGAGVTATAQALVNAKMQDSYISLFILGIICNVFIYIAVNGFANNPHQLGKYLSLFLGVSAFILCGTEHSVADMYYFAISTTLFTQPLQSILRLLVITLGNAVGGVLFPLAEKTFKTLTKNNKS